MERHGAEFAFAAARPVQHRASIEISRIRRSHSKPGRQPCGEAWDVPLNVGAIAWTDETELATDIGNLKAALHGHCADAVLFVRSRDMYALADALKYEYKTIVDAGRSHLLSCLLGEFRRSTRE